MKLIRNGKSHSFYTLPVHCEELTCKLAKSPNLLLSCAVFQVSYGHGHSGRPRGSGSNPRQGEPPENPPQGQSLERFPADHTAVRLVGCEDMFFIGSNISQNIQLFILRNTF